MSQKKRIVYLRGLPASGKSYWAEEVIKQKPNWKRVNKDLLRKMLDDSMWSKANEDFVLKIRDIVIENALTMGYNVIVDDTGFSEKHEKTIRAIAESHDADFEIKFFDTPVQECLRRNALRANPVPPKVIMDMHNRYLKPKDTKLVQDTSLPRAIVVDLDGTLALHVNRGPFEVMKCMTDEVNEPVKKAILSAYVGGTKVIFVSGRTDDSKELTKEWLAKNLPEVPDYQLFMRKSGDMRKDCIIKEEIYKAEVIGKYYIDYVLDDRQQVVDSIRAMGITVFQVDSGLF